MFLIVVYGIVEGFECFGCYGGDEFDDFVFGYVVDEERIGFYDSFDFGMVGIVGNDDVVGMWYFVVGY